MWLGSLKKLNCLAIICFTFQLFSPNILKGWFFFDFVSVWLKLIRHTTFHPSAEKNSFHTLTQNFKLNYQKVNNKTKVFLLLCLVRMRTCLEIWSTDPKYLEINLKTDTLTFLGHVFVIVILIQINICKTRETTWQAFSLNRQRKKRFEEKQIEVLLKIVQS